jgi:hypothetical protein
MLQIQPGVLGLLLETTNANLTSAEIGNLTVSTRYYREVTSTSGGVACTADSNIITIAVAPEIATPAVVAPALGILLWRLSRDIAIYRC